MKIKVGTAAGSLVIDHRTEPLFPDDPRGIRIPLPPVLTLDGVPVDRVRAEEALMESPLRDEVGWWLGDPPPVPDPAKRLHAEDAP